MNNIQIKKLNKYELFVFKHVKQFVCIRFFTKNPTIYYSYKAIRTILTFIKYRMIK